VDSSSWVLIENCDIDCNDDDFCLKSGRDWTGVRVNRPTDTWSSGNVLRARAVACSRSERDLRRHYAMCSPPTFLLKAPATVFHIKSAHHPRRHRGRYPFQNVTLDSVGNAFMFTRTGTPPISYSTLPAGLQCRLDTRTLEKNYCHKVEPPKKGTPHFKDVMYPILPSPMPVKYSRAKAAHFIAVQFQFL